VRNGTLKHKVTAYTLSDSVDTVGQTTSLQNNIGDFWASVQPVSGDERMNDDQVQAEETYRFLLHTNSTINAMTAKDQFSYDGNTYKIRRVIRAEFQPSHLRNSIEFICELVT
tara:strand:+ start:1257 stop:1595 length:339 start_codon:yes stop_codon:yes gene_type:complete